MTLALGIGVGELRQRLIIGFVARMPMSMFMAMTMTMTGTMTLMFAVGVFAAVAVATAMTSIVASMAVVSYLKYLQSRGIVWCWGRWANEW